MHIGTALHAPNGFGSLASGTTYHLLSNRSDVSFTTLTWFYENKNTWKASFIRIPKEEFESALIEKNLIIAATQPTLPPWLDAYQGETFAGIEELRATSKKSYVNRAGDRYEQISELVGDDSEIHQAEDIDRYINRFAKNSSPRQHPDRLKLWYSAYMCFGKQLIALIPPFRNIGRWLRESSKHASQKMGRPHLKKGKSYGHSAIPLADAIEHAYLKFAKLAEPMTEIHRKALTKVFGCKTRMSEDGHEEFFHPQNKPFPTYQQFRYRVVKSFGLPAVQKSKLGETRYRTKVAANEGRFSQSVANLYEQTESDCNYLKELPKKLLSDEPGPSLVVAKIVDVVSSHVLGIGFSYGAEDGDAYRAALFCAAVPKSYFGRLFGLPIDDNNWPSQGLPPSQIADRGPGASTRAHGKDAAPPIQGITPSNSGQSKPTVESAHPRAVVLEGQPTFVVSKLNAIELARREVLRVMGDNYVKDVSSRLTPEMIKACVPANPNGIFNYLNSRGRTDAIPVAVETAIRNFLKPVTFKLNRDGLWLDGFRFDSDAARKTGLHQKVAKGQTIEVPGYAFPMAVRIAWIESNGKVIEVESMLPIRDDVSQLYIPLSELPAYAAKLRELRANQRENASATRAKYESIHFEETGTQWDASTRKLGAAPSRARRKESIPTAGKSEGRKRA